MYTVLYNAYRYLSSAQIWSVCIKDTVNFLLWTEGTSLTHSFGVNP